jgi:hypothetical protein
MVEQGIMSIVMYMAAPILAKTTPECDEEAIRRMALEALIARTINLNRANEFSEHKGWCSFGYMISGYERTNNYA